MLQNIPNDEFIVLQIFPKNKDLIIQISHKDNSVVNVDRQDYINKKNNILSNKKKSTIVNLKDTLNLNFAIKQEKCVDKVLKKLVECKGMTETNR